MLLCGGRHPSRTHRTALQFYGAAEEEKLYLTAESWYDSREIQSEV